MADAPADAPSGVAPGALAALPPVATNGMPHGAALVDVHGPLLAMEVAIDSGRCTQAQLRRFIKSRAYVPMHELRRRFELNGAADDVSAMSTPGGCVYVGLPGRESQLLADLLRAGDIGVELSHDPPVPIVIGVYAMRPISR